MVIIIIIEKMLAIIVIEMIQGSKEEAPLKDKGKSFPSKYIFWHTFYFILKFVYYSRK